MLLLGQFEALSKLIKIRDCSDKGTSRNPKVVLKTIHLVVSDGLKGA